MLLVFSVNSYEVFLWKIKKVLQLLMLFKKILDESNCKPNKIKIDKAIEFYNISMKSWQEKNNIEMYSIHNERKFVVDERFIRSLKNKIYKYVTSI